jgi:hypothetical protein
LCIVCVFPDDDPRAIGDARDMSEFKEIDNHLASFA